jgi:hypothetical protein
VLYYLVIADFRFWDRSHSTILVLNTKHSNKSAGMSTSIKKRKLEYNQRPKYFGYQTYLCINSTGLLDLPQQRKFSEF